MLQEGEEESSKHSESQSEEGDAANFDTTQEATRDDELQADQGHSDGVCLKYVNCRNGFFNGIKCSGGRYCTKWGSGGRVCKKYVNCHKGFFNGINCHGSRYCVSWGLLQEGEEESSKHSESQSEEGDAAAGDTTEETTKDDELQADQEHSDGVCLKYVNCRNGFFNGIKCSGGRYCTKWGSGGRVCRKYVNCNRGFYNGINCHGSRYCVSWGLLQEGEDESSKISESQSEEGDAAAGDTTEETTRDDELQADQEHSDGVCLKYVNCRNGFFNGIKCSGGRYCTKWGSGGRVCRKYVNCNRGFYNGINCHGSRYCVSWGLLQEGEEESSKHSESQSEEGDAAAGDTTEETTRDDELQADQEHSDGVCLKYVNCRNGFFNGIKCSGGRYCTKWGSGGRVCRKYVNCNRGFYNGINCHGSRYCVSWGLLQEGEDESSKISESQSEEGDAAAGDTTEETTKDDELQADQEHSDGVCLKYVNCRNGFFNGIKCSGGRYCTKWGSGGRVCRKYVNCNRGFYNGINCHGSRYCVSWGLLQEGEEESSKYSESLSEEGDAAAGDTTEETTRDDELQADQEHSDGVCLKYVNCRNGFFNGIKCSGGRYCTKWGSGGRVCRKYVNCNRGFYNGINCHGSRYCVSWGLLQEGEEESSIYSESLSEEGDAAAGDTTEETTKDDELQADQEHSDGVCLKYVNCRNGFFNGIKCSGGRYCTKWGSGGRVCRKYVNCNRGFYNGINCHGSRYCVSWGLLQEGEEESSKHSENQNKEAYAHAPVEPVR